MLLASPFDDHLTITNLSVFLAKAEDRGWGFVWKTIRKTFQIIAVV